jgi:hypothetical protein
LVTLPSSLLIPLANSNKDHSKPMFILVVDFFSITLMMVRPTAFGDDLVPLQPRVEISARCAKPPV